jgi:5-methylcytosine-specific restriction protein A
MAYDHITALCNGGRNAESNLQVLCSLCHGQKTGADVAEKSRVARKRAKFLGVAPAKRQKIQSRGFDRAPAQRTASRPLERRS